MKYGTFLLLSIVLSLSAEEGIKSLNPEVEGKTLYRPIAPPIDLRKESKVQEQDQNATHLGGK